MNYYFVHETPIRELLLEANLKYLIKISFNGKYTNRINNSSFNRKNLILEKQSNNLMNIFYDRRFFKINYIFDTTWFSEKKYSKKFPL